MQLERYFYCILLCQIKLAGFYNRACGAAKWVIFPWVLRGTQADFVLYNTRTLQHHNFDNSCLRDRFIVENIYAPSRV